MSTGVNFGALAKNRFLGPVSSFVTKGKQELENLKLDKNSVFGAAVLGALTVASIIFIHEAITGGSGSSLANFNSSLNASVGTAFSNLTHNLSSSDLPKIPHVSGLHAYSSLAPGPTP